MKPWPLGKDIMKTKSLHTLLTKIDDAQARITIGNVSPEGMAVLLRELELKLIEQNEKLKRLARQTGWPG